MNARQVMRSHALHTARSYLRQRERECIALGARAEVPPVPPLARMRARGAPDFAGVCALARDALRVGVNVGVCVCRACVPCVCVHGRPCAPRVCVGVRQYSASSAGRAALLPNLQAPMTPNSW